MKDDAWIPYIADIAGRQDRCVARSELLAVGITEDVIDSLRERLILTGVFDGVYLYGPPRMTHREFLRASVLHAGPEAWPTHRSGLELRGLVKVRTGVARVTTRRRNVDSPVRTKNELVDGGHGLLYVHQSTPTLPLPLEAVDGFGTTLLTRTLVDAAATEGRAVLKPAWREAEFLSLLDPDAIEAELKASPRAGNRLVRERLREAYPHTRPGMVLRSREGEQLFLAINDEAGLPTPLTNVPMVIAGHDYTADFLHADIGLVIETDGAQHDKPEHASRDKVRDLDFFNAGLDVIRLENERMKTHRDWTRASLRKAYERQSRRVALERRPAA